MLLNLEYFRLIVKLLKLFHFFKSGEKDSLASCRPISILTCFSKLFKKSIYLRVFEFFQKHSILTKTQYGFHKNKFTTHAILDFLAYIYAYIDNIE